MSEVLNFSRPEGCIAQARIDFQDPTIYSAEIGALGFVECQGFGVAWTMTSRVPKRRQTREKCVQLLRDQVAENVGLAVAGYCSICPNRLEQNVEQEP